MNIIKSYIVTNAAASSSGGGSGLTTFTSGNLSPLFTASLGADPLVNPALTFTAVNQNANLVYAGPSTGVAAAPTFRALVAADIPITLAGYWKTAGTSILTANTVIDTAQFNLSINPIGGGGNFSFNDGIDYFDLVDTQSGVQWIGGLPDARFNITTANALFEDSRATPAGIEYGASGYETTGSNLTLTTKGYVLGAKTFTGIQTFSLTSLYANNTGIDVVATGGSDILNIGTSNADVINIGYSGSTINITGTLAYQNVTNLQVTDKLFTVNKGGGVGSGVSSGFEIEENAVITGYFATNGTRDGWDFKAPAITGVANLSLASLTGNHTYTLPDANGTFAVSASGNIALSAAGNITFTGVLGAANGGTGIANNAASTLTISGNFATTFTVSGVTGVTLPTSGTLATTAQVYLLASGGTATGANTFTGTTTNIFKYVFDNLGGSTVTNGAGHWLANTTPAAAGAQQISPATVYEGQAWKTNATAESQSVKFAIDLVPVQGAANPSGALRIGSSINGAAYTTRLALTSADVLTIGTPSSNSSTLSVNVINFSSSSQSGSITQGSTLDITAAGTIPITLRASSATPTTIVNITGNSGSTWLANTSGAVTMLNNSLEFRPTSGTATPTYYNAAAVINMTGGANGLVTLFNSAPTVTAAVDVTGFKHNPTNPSNISGVHLAFHATSGNALIGGTALTTSAILDLQSTTRAFIPPRMTEAQRDAIATPSIGMMVYNSNEVALSLYTTAWETILSGLVGAAAPTTNAIGIVVDYFGTSATRVLTTPSTWISIKGSDGNVYKLPAYS